MEDTETKRQRALAHWLDRPDLFARAPQRREWLEAEVALIRGLIQRATGLRPEQMQRILQIGAGPVDVIDVWPAAERHAIDPLAVEYRERFGALQDAAVKYAAGRGEELPYPDNYFDVVVIRNALDHVEDPVRAVGEIRRVLKDTGVLYVWIFLYSTRASLIYRGFNALTKKLEVEPWAFTLSRIKRLFTENGFVLRFPTVAEWPQQPMPRQRAFSKPWVKAWMRKLAGVTDQYGFECVAIPLKNGRDGRLASPFEKVMPPV